MEYFYTVTRFANGTEKRRNFSPEDIRFLLLNAPSEMSIAVTVVRALNWISINPTSVETEHGIADFFTMVYQEWINRICYTEDDGGIEVSFLPTIDLRDADDVQIDMRIEVETIMGMFMFPSLG